MIDYKCASPVLIIIFNRPDFVKNLIDILRQVKPRKLYVVADGPREGVIEDIDNCFQARKQIEQIDWECNIQKKYSAKNLGCGLNPSKGITWTLKDSEEVIILEDDCIPNIDFFKYCDELLDRYRNDQRVMMISGNNHTFGKFNFTYSYEFSHHTQTYGWATWQRAWSKYDFNMELWPDVRSLKWLEERTGSKKSARFWFKIFEMCYQKQLESAWDYQWTFCCWMNRGLNIIPSVNLVTNVGFSPNGTHEIDPDHVISKVPVSHINFPLTHPSKFQNNKELNQIIQRIIYTPPMYKRILNKLSKII